MLTLDRIYHASYVLKNVVRRTDLIYASQINSDAQIYLKTENLQVTGSFKVRGAYYKISQLSEEEKAKGVIACSAGNHAQGVALAATKRGATFIHPFDDPDVIAGQGTIGLELLEQLPDMDAVIVPVGGGGLISGVAFAVKSLNPNCKVYGVQASGAPSMYNSVLHHKKEMLDHVSTIADGIAVKNPGELTYELCEKYVDEIVTVTDDEISTAILALIEQQKLITEGAGAVSVAAAMFNKVDIKGKKVACLLSGGNIDVTILSRVITRGLLKAGRSADLTIALQDKPGQLKDVSRIIAELGGNVTSIYHDRANEGMDINGCFLHIVMETRDWAHVEEIRKALSDAGFQIVS